MLDMVSVLLMMSYRLLSQPTLRCESILTIINFYHCACSLCFREGPPSANLLEEWLNMDHLDPQGVEALQQEMEFGASDIFFRDLDKL